MDLLESTCSMISRSLDLAEFPTYLLKGLQKNSRNYHQYCK
jgi:hypothetical protein